MSIEIRNLSKSFGAFHALHPLDLSIRSGELLALLGPSGCGKTTLLRLIAGLEAPDAGSIHFERRDVSALPAREREVGFVFQHYALFQHLSVFENVAFGLRVRPRRRRPGEAEIRRAVTQVLERVQLGELARRMPEQLSGGQRQRVALARALVIAPKVLLLDEPFGALDAQVRRDLRRWLRELHDELKITSVFVTHDQDEALDVADRIVVLREGRIEQLGSATELYEQPRSAFVCGFLGEVNRLAGVADRGCVQVGEVSWPALGAVHAQGSGPVQVYVRPQDLDLSTAAGSDALPAQIVELRSFGGRARIELRSAARALDHEALRAELPADHPLLPGLERGTAVYLRPRRLAVFPPGPPA